MKSTLTAVLAVAVLCFATVNAQAGHHAKKTSSSAGNIVETAAAAGQFETLIAAAKAAGLAGALSGDGPLTVFAPTDDAFGALPAGTISSLLEPANKDKLATILKFHVVAGRVGSNALADGARLATLSGDSATITEAESGFTINGARIVATDIDASNGVVHVIDRVILPPETMSRTAAMERISAAIDRGVPMFNHGNAAGTAAIYVAAAEALLERAELNHGEQMRLTRGLRASERATDSRESAWQLRYALDDVGASLLATSDMNDTQRVMVP